MNKHKLILMGGLSTALRVPAAVLEQAVGALLEGARLATRFAVEGESVRKGPRPRWLDAACAVEITGLSSGSAVLAMEAPTLSEADAAKFGDGGQQSLFEEIDAELREQTAVDLFGHVLATVVEHDPDKVMADRALLDACVRFAKVAGGGFEGLRLEGLRGRAEPLIVTPAHAPQIELLRDETPPPQAIRLAGTLDTISASHTGMVLTLKDGSKVPARMEEHDPDALRHLFGKPVAVSGMAKYRPSGRLLMLDVESIGEAGPGDRLFETPPVARMRVPVFVPAHQEESSGVSAFFGTWPGDESEEELLEALQALG